MKKRLCILSFSEIARDSRVLREIMLAKETYQLDVLGYGKWQPPEDDIHFVQLKKSSRDLFFLIIYSFWLILGRLIPWFYKKAFWLKSEYDQAVREISKGNYDLVHANDWDALPVAAKAVENTKTRILFDAHEFSPEQQADQYFWRIFVKPYKIFFLRKYLKYANQMITVSTGIRDLYGENFGITPQIILNAQNYQKTRFSPIDSHAIEIIHHGYAIPGRYLEDMIHMIARTDKKYRLNLVLIEKKGSNYVKKLKKLAQKIAHDRVIFWKPVDPSQIVDFISQFDLGLPFLKIPNENVKNALPNKFFDFVMAGLGIIVPNMPSMIDFVEKNKNGLITRSQTIQGIANELNSLSNEEINQFKKNSLELAKITNAETEMKKLARIYQDMAA